MKDKDDEEDDDDEDDNDEQDDNEDNEEEEEKEEEENTGCLATFWIGSFAMLFRATGHVVHHKNTVSDYDYLSSTGIMSSCQNFTLDYFGLTSDPW